MTTLHHPDDELLMSYAAGALNEAHAAVIACHLEFCEQCRERVAEMEAIGGALLDAMALTDAEKADEAFLARTMTRFRREVQHAPPAIRPAAPDPGNETIMPRPLARATGLRRDIIPWQPLSRGVAYCSLPVLRGPGSLRLINIKPGAAMEQHSHGQDQLMLVLWGAFTLEGKRFQRGDVARIEAGLAHQPSADSGEGMVCLAAFGELEPVHAHHPTH
jgi:putative transcriptional regulator